MAAKELLGHYLNDHLAGSVAGRDLAEQVAEENAGTPVGQVMSELLGDIDADQSTLEELMERLGVDKSRLKQAGGWMAEKLTRLRLNDKITGSESLSRLMQMEMLSVGIEGKLALWRSLQALRFQHGDVVDFDRLAQRAQDQLERLEPYRLEAAVDAFSGD